jgi:hypothetical protein
LRARDRHDLTRKPPTAFAISGKRPVPIIALAGEQPDASRVPPHRHAEAVVLDLVYPVRGDGRFSDSHRKARSEALV